MEEAWEQGQSRDSSQQMKFWKKELDRGAARPVFHNHARIAAHFFPDKKGRSARRDPVGGTLLHWCVLLGCGKPSVRSLEHRKLAEFLIDTCDVQILDLAYDRGNSFTCEKIDDTDLFDLRLKEQQYPYARLWYDGETALHLAVAKEDKEMVYALLVKGVSCRVRAYGSFFAPGKDSFCYFGEYPLSFAVSAGLVTIAKMLLETDSEASDLRDSFGNQAVHLAVIHRKIKMYEILKAHAEKRGRPCVVGEKGALGLTPLTMAAFIGPKDPSDFSAPPEVFQAVWQSMASVAWEFTDVIAHTYPLEQVDTLRVKERVAVAAAREVETATESEETAGEVSGSFSAGDSAALTSPPTSPREDAAAGTGSPQASPNVEIPLTQEALQEVSLGVPVPSESVQQIDEADDADHRSAATEELNKLDEKERLERQRLINSLIIADNDRYISLLSVVVHYDLIYMANEEIIIDMLNAKWEVVRWFYYACMLYQALYVTAVTMFTVSMHPKFAGEYDEARLILRAITSCMTLAGLFPLCYDLAVGMRRAQQLTQLRKTTRAEPPKELLKHFDAWRKYRAMTEKVVPQIDNSFWNRITETFPISGFDVLSWVGYLFYIVYLFDDGIGYGFNGYTSVDTDGEPDYDSVPVYQIFLGVAALCAWISALTYAPIHLRLGMVVTMILRTIYLDLMPFMVVFFVLLGGSATALYSLMHSGYDYLDIVDILKDTFLPAIGTNANLNVTSAYPPTGAKGPRGSSAIALAYVLVAVFSLLWALLMLNLFIAALTSTYESVAARAELEYRLQWGRDILLMERRLCLWQKYSRRLRVNHGDIPEHMYYAITRKKGQPEEGGGGGGGGGETCGDNGNDNASMLSVEHENSREAAWFRDLASLSRGPDGSTSRRRLRRQSRSLRAGVSREHPATVCSPKRSASPRQSMRLFDEDSKDVVLFSSSSPSTAQAPIPHVPEQPHPNLNSQTSAANSHDD